MRAQRRCPYSLILCLGLVVLTLPAAAAAADPPVVELEGVAMPTLRQVEGTELRLHKMGLLRWLFFNGYVAGLYLGEGVSPVSVLEDVPKALELHYFRSVPAEGFGQAAQEILERNLDPTTLATVQARVDRIAGLYEDVEPGDRYSLVYVPGEGTRLERNGSLRGVIPGADFASAYFSIWLGDDPMDASLREQLLAP